MELKSKLEALLFYKGEPVATEELARLLGAQDSEVKEALEELRLDFQNRGLALVMLNDLAELRVAAEMAETIRTIEKEERSKNLGKAASETLAIVLYKGPISRAEIDYIRGVNSTFILRNLLIRGLVEKTTNPADQRSYLYRPTLELLAHLGVEKIEDLPDYAKARAELEAFEATQNNEETEISSNDGQ